MKRRAIDSQVKLLCCRIVAGKVPSLLEHFAYLHTQALDSVGRVNGLSDLSWEDDAYAVRKAARKLISASKKPRDLLGKEGRA